MELLIIEDNDIKYAHIVEFLNEIWSSVNVQRAASYQSGIEALVTKNFYLAVLDMTLPASDIHHSLVGMQVFTFGGQLILREAARKRIATRFIVLTQYDTFVRGDKEVSFEELRTELTAKYPHSLLGCVRLDSSSVSWKNELTTLIRGFNTQ